MRTVVLHGPYGGTTFQTQVKHPRKIIQHCYLQPGFEEGITLYPRAHLVLVKDKVATPLTPDDYEMGIGEGDLHVLPAVEGSGFELVALYYGATVATMTWTIGTVAAAIAINIGVSFIVGSIIQALSPSPKASSGEQAKENGSTLFGNLENVVGPGGAVPVVYGTYTVVAQQIATDLSSVEVPYESTEGKDQSGNTTTHPPEEPWQWDNAGGL